MRDRGSAAYPLLVFMVIVFICILVYVTLGQPIAETVGSLENAADPEATGGIYDAVDLAWAVWPIIVVVVGAAWVIVWVYREEHEHAYR